MIDIANAFETVQKSRPGNRGKQRVVVVLGMHRSGTSLLTNLLSVLGVDLGADLLAADSANESGYWENEGIYRTQDALLNHIAKDWGEFGSVYPFPIDWGCLPEFRSYKEQLISIVRGELTAAKGIWGFKDPRTCRLLPLWKQIFAELELEPLYVMAVRNPVFVAESLQKRSGLDPLHSELVWLLHYLDAMRDAGSELRIVVDYDRWFTAPREQAQAIAKGLELPWPTDDTGLVEQLAQTIRPDLRHSQAYRTCSLPFVARIYEALQRAATTMKAPDAVLRAEFRVASECLGAALELSNGAGKIALALGHAEAGAGNIEAALEAYTRATRLQPRLASAFSHRGKALHSLNRPAEALDSVKQALALDPSDTVALQTIETMQNQKQKSKQAADLLFGPGANPVVAPTILPAPIFVRQTKAASVGLSAPPSRTPSWDATATRKIAQCSVVPSNGQGLSPVNSLKPNGVAAPLEVGVCEEIAPGDEMFAGDRTHYFGVGQSALHCISTALGAVKKPSQEIRRILDLPCGHGRVMRFLKASFPNATLTGCDLNRGAVDFCAQTFGAKPVYSNADVGQIPLQEKFDLIWCGSLLTHLREETCLDLVKWFHARLNPGALVIFTLHGRWVERSLATRRYTYGLPHERVDELLQDYYNTGFGYTDYPGQTNYGISVCSPAFVVGRLVATPDLKLVNYHEKGWDNHQDVVCLQRQGLTELLG